MFMYKEMIKKICDELNIKCDFISKDYVCVLKKGNVKKVITGYKFDLNPHALGLVFDDKYATFKDCHKNNIFCLLMDAPHNQKYKTKYRIYTLDINIILEKYNEWLK